MAEILDFLQIDFFIVAVGVLVVAELTMLWTMLVWKSKIRWLLIPIISYLFFIIFNYFIYFIYSYSFDIRSYSIYLQIL
ncbi:hypothetical protein A4G18_06495 [Pasteurellaceae bacterium Pebbles2]|nr:hypothetical protein [Pasteurellaceae bacterium Pebbles2]